MLEKISTFNGSIQSNVYTSTAPQVIKQTTHENKAEIDQQQDKHQQPQSKDQLEKVVKSMNEFVKASNTHLKFQFHDELKEYYVSIVDNTTNEVVKEIPPKKLLDMYAAMTDFLGILVDRKV
ncbi:flagellar protein FlaG [Cytobacillus dafuensis]|uniref:Flagellar protein FlaG n=1 Tax=Cytobacillus dafuensis TaxID=1742359 RepID=A0A5B8Z9E5_CYTDA|nr:flagellar protein FlaG [Cytobacillus dafuensis]QED49594.1 flagellar protein FlaG [Cytobacillus dafuensis]